MSLLRATIRDEVRQALGLGKFPVRPRLGATPAPTTPEPTGETLLPERVTVPTDPILDFGYKLERFSQAQALAGVELEKLGRGIAWLDTGTHQSLLEASQFIGALEARQGLKIACLEEVAYRRGFLNRPELEALVATLPRSSYTEYLVQILKEES